MAAAAVHVFVHELLLSAGEAEAAVVVVAFVALPATPSLSS